MDRFYQNDADILEPQLNKDQIELNTTDENQKGKKL